mgnify:CR=1 FL=1
MPYGSWDRLLEVDLMSEKIRTVEISQLRRPWSSNLDLVAETR